MINFKQSGFRALRHAAKAIQRGDLHDAFRWMFIADRLAAVATRVSDLHGHKHRPRPLPPKPEPPPPPPPTPPARSRAKEKDPRDVPGYRNPVA
jgi:hypothetical protein